MKKKSPLIAIILIVVLIILALSPGAVSASNNKELIIGFKNNTTLYIQQQEIAKYDCTVLETNEVLNCALVQVNGEDTQQFMNMIPKDGLVKYAEPNKLVHALYTPNDPYYSQQWGPQHITVNSAWDIERGNKNVTIAIIDSGIDYTHEDLVNNYLALGYDWVNRDPDPWDDNGHGTHCAGIAAATLDNEKGIAGIAQVNLMAEKVLNETGVGTDWDAVQGITHATDNNADIISMSFGGDDAQVMEDACLYAWNNGCLLVAASGNEYMHGVSYPAAYETVIAVGAIDQNDHRCDFSNWGPNLELSAPGINILSSYLSDQYAWGTGTSMAAPHVAGVAALVLSKFPLLSNLDVRDRLIQTAYDLGAVGFDEHYGYGRVDARNATTKLAPTVSVLYPNSGEVVFGTITLRATANDPKGIVTNVEFLYSSDNGTKWTSLANRTIHLFGEYRYNWNTTTVSNGAEYLIKAIATDDNGATAADVSDATFEIANKLIVHTEPNTTIVNQLLVVSVTYNTYPGTPVDNATVFFEIGGAQFLRTTDTTGIAAFTPAIIGLLNITAVKSGYLQSDMVTVEVMPGEYGINLTSDGTAKSIFTDVNATYMLTVENTGYFLDNYTLTIDNPDGADTVALKENVTMIDNTHYKTVDVNRGGCITVLLNVANSIAGSFRVNVTAKSTGNTTKIDYVNTTTTVEEGDITPPEITFVAPTPADGATINASYVNINVTLNETGSIAYLNWNGVNETMAGSGTNFFLNKSGLADTQYTYKVYANDTAGNMGESEKRVVTIDTIPPPIAFFDTGQPQNPYPSISGTHNGTITPSQKITVHTLYTYPCAGTGGHTEYARIWNSTLDANATWNGYQGDWYNITFNKSFVLFKNKTYNYTIITGSYPQIIHARSKDVIGIGGTINCTEFTDANGGKKYENWVPAIRLVSQQLSFGTS